MTRTALVTGGAKRIGKAICLDLARNGYDVAVHYASDRDSCNELIDEIKKLGVNAFAIEADLTQKGEPEKLFANAVEAAGQIDLLVNNASIFENDTAFDFTDETLEMHHAIHVRAPLQLASRFAKQEHLESGLIVNIIDQRVWRLNPGFFTYTLSKSALWAATQTMAQAFAPRVRVNAIGPGPTLANQRQSDADFKKQTNNLILKKGPDLGEFGVTIRYLFEASSVTGQMIALDGGQHLAWRTPDIDGIKE